MVAQDHVIVKRDIERSETGYSESSNARVRADVGSVDYLKSKIDDSTGNVFVTGGLTQEFAKNDPIYDPANLIDDGQPSVMEQIGEEINVDWNVNLNTSGMMRNANMALTDGAAVANQRDGGIEVVEEKLATQEAAWDCLKGQAIECLKEAAAARGDSDITPAQAEKSIVAAETGGLGKLDAALAGAGSFVTGPVGGAAYLASEIAADRKDLSADEKESLIAEAHQIAQSSGPQDTRASAPTTFAVAGKSYEADISCLDEHAFECILTENLDQQREYQDLVAVRNELDAVERNHNFVADNIGQNNVEYKTEVAAAAGQNWASAVINEATVYENVQPVVEALESWQVELSGADLSGFSGFKMDSNQVAMYSDALPSASETSTKLSAQLFDYNAAAGNLVADAHQQLRV